jgi:phosphopentomutase
MKTGSPIVYTSADSVFQIAAHEDIIPIQELYRICEIARKILDGEHRVARVIARPFIGEPGNFARTPRRHDYSVLPPHTILNTLVDSGIPVHAVGKIHDIFAGQGISSNVGTVSNMDGVDKTLEAMKNIKSGLIFVNLVDFDMLFGHRRDVLGYGKAIMEFDTRLPEIEAAMTENDILLLTADHGCDPAFVAHTDHTREYIPLLLHGQKVRTGALGTQEGFTNIARFVLSYLLPENKELATIPGSLTADKILS